MAGELVAGVPIAGGDALNFTAGVALTGARGAARRLAGVAATTIGGIVLVLDVLVEAGPSTIRIGSSIDPGVLARGVAVISLRMVPPVAAGDDAEFLAPIACGWAGAAECAPGGGTVAGPIIAYGFCQAGFWHPAAANAAASKTSNRFIGPTSVPEKQSQRRRVSAGRQRAKRILRASRP